MLYVIAVFLDACYHPVHTSSERIRRTQDRIVASRVPFCMSGDMIVECWAYEEFASSRPPHSMTTLLLMNARYYYKIANAIPDTRCKRLVPDIIPHPSLVSSSFQQYNEAGAVLELLGTFLHLSFLIYQGTTVVRSSKRLQDRTGGFSQGVPKDSLQEIHDRCLEHTGMADVRSPSLFAFPVLVRTAQLQYIGFSQCSTQCYP